MITKRERESEQDRQRERERKEIRTHGKIDRDTSNEKREWKIEDRREIKIRIHGKKRKSLRNKFETSQLKQNFKLILVGQLIEEKEQQ